MVIVKNKISKVVSIIVMFAIIINHIGTYNLAQAETNTIKQFRYEGNGYNVIYKIDSSWSDAFNATITIENTSNNVIDNWSLAFYMPHEITNIWNANINYCENDCYIIKNANWNQDIPVSGSVQFGFTAKKYDTIFIPQCYYNFSYKEIVNNEIYNFKYDIINDWGNGFQGQISIENNSELYIEDWIIEFDYNREITSIWNAEIISNCNNHYVVKNCSYIQNLAPEQEYLIGFIGEGGTELDIINNVEVYQVRIMDGFKSDSDGDGINDLEEIKYDMNIYSNDTDSDGLPDKFELFDCGTSPIDEDTDDDGVKDIAEDVDEDGLMNLEEYNYCTAPGVKDTDMDGINDYEEVYVYNTNPLVKDTDDDKLSDYDEVVLGFNPLLEDTDNDGIIDCNEEVEQILEKNIYQYDNSAVQTVTVSMKSKGNIENTVCITNMYDIDKFSSNVVGLVGVPVEISCNSEFDSAKISFKYNKEALGKTKEEDLAIMWYDEANNWYQILDNDSVIDFETQTVTYETTHFSQYMLVDKKIWYDAWKDNLDYRSGGDNKSSYNFAFVVDVSGSMYGAPINTAKKALIQFADLLSIDDDACLIEFESYATLISGFGSKKQVIIDSINNLQASGGTNVNAGLIKAIEQYPVFNNTNDNIIVLICDGDVNYYEDTVQMAINKNISIYTINVGNKNSDTYLKKIAEKTGGEYYYCKSVEDIETVCGIIQNKTIDNIDKTDTDGDGLFDIYETVGIKLSNGRITYSDPQCIDTDNDNLTDFEEIGYIYNIEIPSIPNGTNYINNIQNKRVYIGNGEMRTVKYALLHSDPIMEDSDYDGIRDDVDESPWKYDTTNITLFKTDRQKGIDEFGNIADDMTFNDYSKDELLEISKLMNYEICEGEVNPEILFYNLKDMSLDLFSRGELEDVIVEMIEHFEKGNGSDYTNNVLTENVKTHNSSKMYMENVKDIVVSTLKKNGGNLNALKYYVGSKDKKDTIQYCINTYDKPMFNTWKDKMDGLTICINDTWAHNVEITDYQFDGVFFKGKVKITIYDHFGLDVRDVEKIYVYLAGFRSWFVLQHYDFFDGKYLPFVDIMEFEESFEGRVQTLQAPKK